MLPIVFGVVLLTFVLFHVVGGSPASFALGKNASAKALDEFDRQHGYDRPLFWGTLLKTRIFKGWAVRQEVRDEDSPAPESGITRGESQAWVAELHYPLRPDTEYVLRLTARSTNQAVVTLGDEARPPLSERFHRVDIPFRTGSKTADGSDVVLMVSGDAEIRESVLFERASNPWNSQFAGYLQRLARMDFGVSSDTGERVAAMLRRGALPSLLLNVPILIGTTLLAVLMALLCAWRRDRAVDRFMVVAATALMSVNYIVWIVAGQYLLAYRLGWFPIWGFESWRYLLLPVAIGIATGLGRDVRFYRTVMLEEVGRDYVKTAQAKGLGAGTVLFRHVLKNALPPIITNVSLSIPFLFTGSLLLESFFGIPGLGGLSVNAINSSDMAVIQAVVLIGALLYVVVNLLTDLCYAWVDPRVRLK